jgi:hypothetical protein
LADAFALIRREGSREQFFSPEIDPVASLRCAPASTLALTRDPDGLREKFFSCPQKSPSIFCTHSPQSRSTTSKRRQIMGLDMYAFTTQKSLVTSAVDFKVEEDALRQLHYWRKHPDLHGWMENLYQAKGGQDSDFNLSAVALDSADLDALETALKATDLPKTGGFFFGASDGSERDDDLEFIRKAREALNSGLAVFYVAWW